MLNHPALIAAMVDFLVVVSPTVNQNEILKPLSVAGAANSLIWKATFLYSLHIISVLKLQYPTFFLP